MISVFDHPWLGGLFADDEARAIWSPARQLDHMLAFEAAWSRGLGAAGRVPEKMAATAATAIADWPPDFDRLRRGTAKDGLPVPALVQALKEDAGEAAAAIHAGATSQDVIDTALAMTLRETSDLVETRMNALHTALADLTDRCGGRALMGRTRMQAAVPIKVADRIAAWADPLPRHRTRLAEIRPRVERLQVGGAAGDRAALGAVARDVLAVLSRDLGLASTDRSWHTARDGIAEYAGFLSSIAGTAGKIGQDICLMGQQGIDEITLSRGGGSSSMPHKNNPIRAELLVTLARFAATQVSALHQAQIHEQERSGTAWALEWMTLPPLAVAATSSLNVATAVIRDVEEIGSA